MLIVPYVGEEQPFPVVEVVKFVDRIWLDSSGNAVCFRSVILQVANDSPAALGCFLMLTPVERDQLADPKDQSDTYLRNADDFYFNSTKTHGYRVVQSTAERGVVEDDGVQGVSVSQNRVSVYGVENASLIRVEFDEPAQPGAVRGVRLAFEVAGLAQALIAHTLTLELPYYSSHVTGRRFSEALNTLAGRPQIPALPVLDGARRGGFDVILYLPPGMRGRGFDGAEMRIDDRMPDGAKGESREKYMFHLRLAVPPERLTEPVKLGEGFTLAGHFGMPVEAGITAVSAKLEETASTLERQTSRISTAVDDLEHRVATVANRLRSANRIAIVSLAAGALALSASIVAIVVSVV